MYPKSDVLLLADVFENFRKMCLEIYELDLAKFISAPGLAWQAALKKLVKLDLIADLDMLLLIEKGIRGGRCNTVRRNTKASDKYMRDYDLMIKIKNLCYSNYWGANNLYGWAMSQKLPTFNFEWVEGTSQFIEVFIKNYDGKSELGYILDIDVKYPKEIYELHGDLPFLPERKKLGKVEKIVTNLTSRSEYVIHIKSLKQVLSHGLILKKVYRVIGFNEDEWLKPYIEMNNKLRTEAKNHFEKDFSINE